MHRSVGSRLFTIGHVVADRYRVERSLQHDRTTALYAVLDLETQRAVALKTPNREHLENDKLIARFHRERELSQRFEHPNVLRVESVFETRIRGVAAPVLCMLCELIEGESLAERLAASGAMSADEALPIACQLAEALAASHRAGVVHRDLKPESVVLTTGEDASMRAVLTDFGIARGAVVSFADTTNDSLTATNVVLGTPVYMAPEQLDLETATPATDIYALGLMIYEMVTGRLPFMAASTLQTVFKRVREDPPSPRLYEPSLSRAWEQTILRCLARDPKDRLANGDVVAAALRGEHRELTAASERRGGSRLRRWLRTLGPEPKDS